MLSRVCLALLRKLVICSQNLSHWVCGWVDWNLALDKHGAPNWAKNFVDSPIIVIPENDEFYKQPMYYALYHISRFVPPGSKRIFSSGLENYNGIKTIAFLTPEDLVVIVILNKLVKSTLVSLIFMLSFTLTIQHTNW